MWRNHDVFRENTTIKKSSTGSGVHPGRRKWEPSKSTTSVRGILLVSEEHWSASKAGVPFMKPINRVNTVGTSGHALTCTNYLFNTAFSGANDLGSRCPKNNYRLFTYNLFIFSNLSQPHVNKNLSMRFYSFNLLTVTAQGYLRWILKSGIIKWIFRGVYPKSKFTANAIL